MRGGEPPIPVLWTLMSAFSNDRTGAIGVPRAHIYEEAASL
jgi:hypothetical protein